MAGDDESSSPELVGRARECAVIDRLLGGAARGESGVLVLRGEAGMGKTALLGYAAARATDMRILRATGVEAEHDLAFAGLHGLLWPIIVELGRLPEPQRGALAAALGLAPGDGRDRFLASAGALTLLAAAAEAKPILCLIDDAQWLDASSADALVFTARRLVAEGVVILFGAREGELRRFDAPGLEELALTGLDRESSVALLGRASSPLAPAVQDRLLSEAEGNPLALLELPVALSDSQLTGKAQLPGALPLTARLRGLFIQRIERLPQSAQTALLVAAAEERGELAVTLRATAELTLPQNALDPAEETGLVRTQGAALTFRHPLVRSAVYDSAPAGRRQQVHAALAAVLGREQHSDRALWHRAMATLTPDSELACALEASAARSQQRGGHASAATAFERAAELSDGDAARAARLTRAAEAAWVAGQADRARGLIDRALPAADDHQRARLLYLTGVIEGRQGWLKHGVAALLAAATLSDDPTLSLQILREAASMAVYAGDYEEVIAIGARVDQLPQGGDIDRYIVAAIAASAADMSGDHARGAALADLALELAERLDDPMCLVSAAATAARQRVAADGLSFARRAVDIARERALVTALPLALQALARALIDWSQFDLAYSAAEEGWRLAIDVDQSWAASLNLAYLARIDALRGADQLLIARVEALQALVASTGAKAIASSTAMSQGLLELGRGRPAEAFDWLLEVVSVVRPESNPMFMFGLPDAVEAAVRAGRFDEVDEHLTRFRTWVEHFPSPTRRALLARCLALVEDSDAEQHFTRAIELGSALSPFDNARNQLLYGEWLRRQRRRIDARLHLRAALEIFQQLATTPWEARTRSELRASGETARKRDPSTRDQLTPQELQISRLVASGKTNPEVAAQLFLSPRTIDYHLRKVFTKLDIASRTELAAADLGELAAF